MLRVGGFQVRRRKYKTSPRNIIGGFSRTDVVNEPNGILAQSGGWIDLKQSVRKRQRPAGVGIAEDRLENSLKIASSRTVDSDEVGIDTP